MSKIIKESPEENLADSSLPLDDSSFANYENSEREVMPVNEEGEEVVGYLDKEKATLVLGSQRIELDGNRLIFAQGPGNELLLYLSADQEPSVEYSLLQSISENSDNHTFATQCGLNTMEGLSNEDIQVIERRDFSGNNDKNGTLHIQQAHVDSYNNHSSSEPLGYDVQEEEGTTEMIFIPLSNSADFLSLSDIIHPTIVASKLHGKEEIGCVGKISDVSSVIQMHADSYSSKVEDVGVSTVNKEDNNNCLQDEHMASEIESSLSVEDSSSMLCMPPQTIGHTVSDIHLSKLTLAHDLDCKLKNIREGKIETEETEQSNITLPSRDANFVECSNLNDSLDPELFSESFLIRESSKHSDLKYSTDSSNKYGNQNSETSATVEETMDQDTNESIHFPPLLPFSENIVDDDSKQKIAIDCNHNDSNVSVDKNLDNKKFYLSSNNCDDEMDFINSEEACSEIQTGLERAFLSLREDSETKGSFFSDNSKPKYCNQLIVNKIKSVSPSEVKVIDEHDFENNSSNLDQELSHDSSLNWQSSDDKSIEVDANKVSQSLNSDFEGETENSTFQGVLNPITKNAECNENLIDGKNSETYCDDSRYLFNQVPLHTEEHSCTKLLKRPNVKFFEHKQNSVLGEVSHADDDRKSDENILAFKNTNIDIKIKENDSMFLNIAASDENSVKPPQRTDGQQKKPSDSDRNIELFSDDSSDYDPKLFLKNFFKDNEKETDEYSSADEDGYVNLMPSIVKNKIKARNDIPVAERTISLKLVSSENLEKVTDAEDSVNICEVGIDDKDKDSTLLNIADSVETTVLTPLKTYSRRKRTCDSVRCIGLFSNYLSDDNEPNSTSKVFCIDKEKGQIFCNKCSIGGCIHLMPSEVKNGDKGQKTPVDERTITLTLESSDDFEKLPDPVIDAEDSLSVRDEDIDNKSKENDSIFLNVSASDETDVKPPQITYSQKKRSFDSFRNIESVSDVSTSKIFCGDNKNQQIMIDEDGYVDSIPSIVKNSNEAKNDSPIIDTEHPVSSLDVATDKKGQENHNVLLNEAASYETCVKPPLKTYGRKKSTSVSVRSLELFPNDFSDLDNENGVIDEYSLPDEDGYINLFSSIVKSRIKGETTPVDERTITLSPELISSVDLEKTTDFDMDDEDSVDIFYESYLIGASFKSTNTEKPEGDTQKASSQEVPKAKSHRISLKKRMETPSYKKITSKVDRYKIRQYNNLTKSYPIKTKNASSDERKVRGKVKKQIKKTVANFENSIDSPISIVHKKYQPSKDGKKGENISLPFSIKESKMCSIRFLDDKSTEKNNYFAIDQLSAPSTSNQELKNFEYICWKCDFVSNRANNLIQHLKYCLMDPLESQIPNMEQNEEMHRTLETSSESFPSEEQTLICQNFSNGSIYNEFSASQPGTSKASHMSMPVSTKPHYHQ